jgi:hypothetical protein
MSRWAAALWLVATFCAPLPADQAEDDRRVEQFLARLGLIDLQILQREKRLRSTEIPETRSELARGLADLYAERLMSSGDDPARYAELTGRIELLLRDFPDARTTALQVMLAQADYNRAESLINAWINDPRDDASRQDAAVILARIAPQLAQLEGELNEQAEALLAELDRLPEGDLLQEREGDWKRVRSVAGRAIYFAAWSQYYLGLVGGAGTGAEPYARARELFRRALGLEAGLPPDGEPEWLGLESIWRARALLGLGLSEAACGDPDACERCFQLLQHAGTSAEVRDQAPAWHLRALLHAGLRDRALSLARDTTAEFHPPASQGQVSFCVALVRDGWGIRGEETAAIEQSRRELGRLGLQGLARLGQLGAIQTLMERYEIPVDDRSGFVLLWARGHREFSDAEAAGAPEGYAAAARTLLAALAAPDAAALAGPASRCRYTLAWCRYRTGDWEQAAGEFADALTGLEAAGDPLAVEAAWMTFVAYQQLIPDHPRFTPAAEEALQRIARSFPDHPYAQRAQRELTRLSQRQDPEQLARHLETIPPTDEDYLQTRYELCLLRHRLWSERRRSDPAAAPDALAALREATDVFLRAAGPRPDPTRALQSCLLVADAALQADPPQLEVAQRLLDRARPWAAELSADNPLVAEYHYRQFQRATRGGDAAQRREQAQWLADHAAGSPYELAALVVVANALDQGGRDQGGRDQDAGREQDRLEQAYTIYGRIVALLDGPAAAGPDNPRNAHVARSRLAHYAAALGHHQEAAGLLDQLLAARPGQQQLVRRAAAAHAAAGNHDRALVHWRALLQGLPQGTESWYEAKYQQIRTLAQIDREQAGKVYRQFELLYPDLGGAAWRERFEQLTRRW